MSFDINEWKKFLDESSIDEGRRERDWIKQQPEEFRKAYSDAEEKGLKISQLAWIRKTRGGEPIEDIVPDVLKFLSPDIQKKLKDNDFQTDLTRKNYPTVNDLRRIIKDISDSEEAEIQYDQALKDPSEVEFLGKVGKWELIMPVTQRGSVACDISGKDTTWCTQKRTGQNLFYSYVARPYQSIVLFYVMDYSRTPDLKGKDVDARISVGFINQKPDFRGMRGGLSVNAQNEGLTSKILKEYLKENYDEIMSILQKKAEEVGENHPAKQKIKKAAVNIFYLKKLVKDYKKDEREDFYEIIAQQEKISPQVMRLVIYYIDYQKAKDLASSESTDPKLLRIIANDEDFDQDIRAEVARNESAPKDILVKLAFDRQFEVYEGVVYNKKTPIELLIKIYKEHHSKYLACPLVLRRLSVMAKKDERIKEITYNLVKNHFQDGKLYIRNMGNSLLQVLFYDYALPNKDFKIIKLFATIDEDPEDLDTSTALNLRNIQRDIFNLKEVPIELKKSIIKVAAPDLKREILRKMNNDESILPQGFEKYFIPEEITQEDLDDNYGMYRMLLRLRRLDADSILKIYVAFKKDAELDNNYSTYRRIIRDISKLQNPSSEVLLDINNTVDKVTNLSLPQAILNHPNYPKEKIQELKSKHDAFKNIMMKNLNLKPKKKLSNNAQAKLEWYKRRRKR